MASALRSELRERLRLRAVLSLAALLALFRLVLDASLPQLATMTATVVAGSLSDAVVEAYNLRDDVEHLGFAPVAFIGGGALLVYDDGSLWASVLLFVPGVWVVLDTVQTIRHEGLVVEDATRDGHEVYREYVGRQVHGALRDEPLTRRELIDRLEPDAADVDAAIDDLLEEGAIERRGSALRVAESSDFTTLGDRLEWLVRRVARPIAIELRST